ncbi:MAG: transcriptional repressor [Acidimicrobiia bacterium]|nr:transcriptional repressor [Acidimicrobiia bacterium]
MDHRHILDRFGRHGLRVTPQRRAVAVALSQPGPVHLTADGVLDLARQVVPEVSRATVYNTLNELVTLGELRAVTIDDGPVRFDPNIADEHSHSVCRSCGAIDDVPMPDIATAPADGFVVEGIELILRGICARCDAEGGAARPPLTAS